VILYRWFALLSIVSPCPFYELHRHISLLAWGSSG
jgi:hypothetical protein